MGGHGPNWAAESYDDDEDINVSLKYVVLTCIYFNSLLVLVILYQYFTINVNDKRHSTYFPKILSDGGIEVSKCVTLRHLNITLLHTYF
jgi:hypothetical protein